MVLRERQPKEVHWRFQRRADGRTWRNEVSQFVCVRACVHACAFGPKLSIFWRKKHTCMWVMFSELKLMVHNLP